jgi:hypothetical protein
MRKKREEAEEKMRDMVKKPWLRRDRQCSLCGAVSSRIDAKEGERRENILLRERAFSIDEAKVTV